RWSVYREDRSVHLRRCHGRSGRIEWAHIILSKRETREHADGRRNRHRDQQAYEAEQIAEGKQGEHHPYRIKMYAAADQIRCQYIARECWANKKKSKPQKDRGQVRPFWCDRKERKKEETEKRAEIGDEAY